MKTEDLIMSDSEAYELLRDVNCPIKLPTARSMTQAKNDLQHIKDKLHRWRDSEGEFEITANKKY